MIFTSQFSCTDLTEGSFRTTERSFFNDRMLHSLRKVQESRLRGGADFRPGLDLTKQRHNCKAFLLGLLPSLYYGLDVLCAWHLKRKHTASRSLQGI